MSKALGFEIIAEGVETEDHLALLRETGCNMAQGYLFSRPLPRAELVTWLKSWPERTP
jgi:EAL domain-containing protein (putative c-di-GMP-specific phosphodiesterase class I)